MESRRDKKEKKTSSKTGKVLLIILADILLLAACLSTFAYFHHVRPKKSTTEPIIIQRPTDTPSPVTETANPDADTAAEPTEALPLTWKEKFADKFSDDGIIQTENSFISENTHITITKYEKTIERDFQGKLTKYPIVYYVADIYITDVEQFAATFAKDEYMPGASGSPLKQVTSNNGIVGVNGDNYGSRGLGLVIRNGALYRQELYEGDVMVLYYDGTMEPIFFNNVNVDAIIAKSPYQAWCFGPVLVKDGEMVISPQSLEKSSDYMNGDNPRTAIGYYEPGHYCMVVVEGRTDDSIGVDTTYLSQIFVELGCESAYNLDGGRTSAMVFNSQYVNVRANGGRHSNDTIIITDPDYNKEDE